MNYRTLGKTGIRISELFLGAMTFGEQGGVGAPLAECRSMLDAYFDAGGNVIDTEHSPSDAPASQSVAE